MERRDFVKNTSLYSGALYTLGLSACKQPKEISESKLFVKLSLAQWSLHKAIQESNMDPFIFAQKANEWGFEGIEYVNQLYNPFLSKYTNQLEGINHFVNNSYKESEEWNVDNLLIMVDGEGDLAIKDKATRDISINNHKKWIDAASGLGCHSIRINLFGELEAEQWQEASQESLLKLSAYAKMVGINVLVENHGYLSSNAKLLIKVIENVNQKNCGTLPDFGNFCLRREGNAKWGNNCLEEYDRYQGVNELMKYAKAVSAKSYDFDDEGFETTINYQKMIKILKDNNYNGYVGVEYEGSNMSEKEGILATKKLITKYI